MATEKIADLRRLTPKLKEAEAKLKQEIQVEGDELEESKTAVSRGEIELSLIHDAFFLKFGQIGNDKLKDAMQAMDNLNQIEILELELSHEMSRAKQADAEMERISALAPEKPVEEIDLQPLLDQEKEINEKLASLKIRNSKREKNSRLTESNIASINVEIDELNEQLKERKKREEESQKQAVVAEQIKNEIIEISNQIKEKNQAVKETQAKLAQATLEIDGINELILENQDKYKKNIKENNDLKGIMSKVVESNKPWEKMKAQHDDFNKKAANYKETMSGQLKDINSLIDVLKAELEQNVEQ